MKYYNEESGIFSYDDEPDEDYYEMAENAEYVEPPCDNGNATYWAGLNGGYVTPTHTWKELENAWKKLDLTPGERKTSEATPDDWLDTALWVKSLKEKQS